MGAAGAPICMMASFVDVTERKRAEEALRESREKYYQLFENESDAVTIFDVETLRIEDANRAALDMYGYTKEEFLALKITDLSAEEEKTRLGVQRIMKGEPGSNRVPLRYMKKKDGTVFPAEIGSGIFFSGERKKLIGAVRDVTERIHAEEEKRKLAQLYYHSQKLEALGALAGGIAHDVNNLMGIILSNMELARMKAQENISPYLDRAISAVERGKGIVRNLMNFPHGTPSAQGPVDLGAVTRETIRLLEKDTDEGIAVKVNAQPGLRPVGGNPAELQQMVLNLFLNARDAVASRAFGGNDRDSFIHFTLDNVSIPEAHLPENMRHPTGDFVRLTVTDNGCGMDKETVSRIFEPYFTTKGEGGSGLGLSTVWSIVKQCNGWIDVKSTPEEGTEFQIYLPWWKEEIPAEGLPLSRGQVGGAETVLIVDDEQHIANASREMLEQLGYNVLVAYSAGEALNIYREKHDSIDLVFSDIVMPDRSGIKLLAAIKEIDPDVKVVLTSGKELISCGNSTELQGISFLAKPYSLNEFAGRVRSMLGDRKAAKTMKDHLNKINFYYVKEKTFPYDERVISSDILYNIFRDRLSSDVKERFIVVLLDSEKRIIAYEEVGSGTVGEAFVYIREVIRSAIITNAHSIVLIHNHTSGVPKPSLEDIRLTLEISRACSIHNIKLLDHLIIGGDGYCSFSKRGLL
jgi:PAS domain S-box-containing protein